MHLVFSILAWLWSLGLLLRAGLLMHDLRRWWRLPGPTRTELLHNAIRGLRSRWQFYAASLPGDLSNVRRQAVRQPWLAATGLWRCLRWRLHALVVALLAIPLPVLIVLCVLPFLVANTLLATRVAIDDQGVSIRRLGRKRRYVPWSDIKTVGETGFLMDRDGFVQLMSDEQIRLPLTGWRWPADLFAEAQRRDIPVLSDLWTAHQHRRARSPHDC
ncbi:PH domain-containing protein [Andreprevotia lacus DSM 23236]|uniref:PH domain-containing protein n=1 Tax=Andreprevotia lacus DSM 23236 TaxID=1121001 RepID=A0A1W1X7L0_9NEIS|nr:PH domain-containing protein [Andreprevotia lacus]SMC19827.1 PH domain-containing protein [Andreprevotia lacus DSM 23236]